MSTSGAISFKTSRTGPRNSSTFISDIPTSLNGSRRAAQPMGHRRKSTRSERPFRGESLIARLCQIEAGRFAHGQTELASPQDVANDFGVSRLRQASAERDLPGSHRRAEPLAGKG